MVRNSTINRMISPPLGLNRIRTHVRIFSVYFLFVTLLTAFIMGVSRAIEDPYCAHLSVPCSAIGR